mmetsp:Transcript_62811/g.134884  ORF Transcript_62811/g.134884 Transcript_62811/m.134884 type:complete len:347 (+) Transcript_62811:277-1317(+)
MAARRRRDRSGVLRLRGRCWPRLCRGMGLAQLPPRLLSWDRRSNCGGSLGTNAIADKVPLLEQDLPGLLLYRLLHRAGQLPARPHGRPESVGDDVLLSQPAAHNPATRNPPDNLPGLLNLLTSGFAILGHCVRGSRRPFFIGGTGRVLRLLGCLLPRSFYALHDFGFLELQRLPHLLRMSRQNARLTEKKSLSAGRQERKIKLVAGGRPLAAPHGVDQPACGLSVNDDPILCEPTARRTLLPLACCLCFRSRHLRLLRCLLGCILRLPLGLFHLQSLGAATLRHRLFRLRRLPLLHLLASVRRLDRIIHIDDRCGCLALLGLRQLGKLRWAWWVKGRNLKALDTLQ